VILSDDGKIISTWVDPHAYNNGYKLIEHSYVGNHFMEAVESLICPTGMFYKSRVVWAGDYGDSEPGAGGKNLYELVEGRPESRPQVEDMSEYLYVVNHTKQEYMYKGDHGSIHCLSIMTAEGNGRGGGDYDGPGMELVGSWARDVISVEKEAPNFVHIPNEFEVY
jgi:hypothetical protein